MRLALALVLVLAACGPGDGAPERTFHFGSASPSPTGTAAAAAWRRVADITTPRSEVAAAVFRGVVYVVGGFGGGNVAETYVADRWSPAPRYPIAVDHAMAAGVDTAGTPGLYVFGGNLNGLPVARSFRFFGDQGWREIAPMPGPRSQAAAVAIGGRKLSLLQNLATFECYDPAADAWEAMPDAPTARGGVGAATIGSR
ncbi:MAG TPA: kelch repeat-containing protein, partial [Candidatus Limnocylindria bacterium]